MKIFKPAKGHADSAFRAIIDIWETKGYCEVQTTQEKQVWCGSIGKVLLYDFDHLRYLPTRWQLGLFANVQHPRGIPWTYFPRSPALIERMRFYGCRGFADRSVNTIFLGSVENYRQLYWRCGQQWGKSVDSFLMPIYHKRGLADMPSYLEQVSNARFGLCLRGNGPKCSREVELMALGTVPIFTPGVSSEYFNELIEGVHYIRVRSPKEIRSRLESIRCSDWELMSAAGQRWYQENASPDGCFRLTKKIVDEYFAAGVQPVVNAHTLGWAVATHIDRPLYAIDRVLNALRTLV